MVFHPNINAPASGRATKEEFIAWASEAWPKVRAQIEADRWSTESKTDLRIEDDRTERKPSDRLLSLREAADRAHMGASTLRQALYAGHGPPGLKTPGSNRWRFWRSELDAWINSRQR
jgi:predicted DNA-binding transcriptional regulator AlpA